MTFLKTIRVIHFPQLFGPDAEIDVRRSGRGVVRCNGIPSVRVRTVGAGGISFRLCTAAGAATEASHRRSGVTRGRQSGAA